MGELKFCDFLVSLSVETTPSALSGLWIYSLQYNTIIKVQCNDPKMLRNI